MNNIRTKKRTLTLWSSFLFITLSALFVGCNNDKDYYDPNYAPQISGILNFFDFKSSVNVSFDLILDEPEATTYNVYTENPFQMLECGSIVMKEITPVTFISTDDNGVYSGTVTLPANLQKFYLYNLHPDKVLSATVSGSVATIDEDYAAPENDNFVMETAASKGTRAFNDNYGGCKLLTLHPDGTSKTWDENQVPTNATNTKGDSYNRSSEEAKMYRQLYNVSKALGFVEGKTPTYDIQQDIATDLVVKEGASPTDVKVTFVGGFTGATSTLAYYCYDGNNPPAAKEITKLPKAIIFYNSAPEQYNNSKCKIRSGMTVTLRYIKPDGTFGNSWPSGTKIGFVSYNNKNVQYPMYSTPFNNKKFTKEGTNYWFGCCATIPYQFTDNKVHILMGMEDWNYNGGGDKDMNDIILEIHGVTTKLPPIVTTGEQIAAENKGLLIFEDNWPSMGDYDLNDLVVTYNLKKTFERVTTIDNNSSDPKVTITYSNPKITDTFVLKHYGANYDNSFAYEMNLDNNEVDGGKNAISITRDGQTDFDYEVIEVNTHRYIIYVQHYVKTSGFGLEHRAQALDFWNTPQANRNINYTVTVPIKFRENSSTAPTFPNLDTYFNPFILKYAKDNTSGNNYSMEIHCIGKAPSHPNALAAYDTFATKGENNIGKSDLWPHNGEHEWYSAKDNFPFAINFNADSDASVLQFNYPDEQQKIGDKYTYFKDWANSGGTQHTDWWK